MNKYNTLFNKNYKKIFGIFIQNVKNYLIHIILSKNGQIIFKKIIQNNYSHL